MNPRPPSRGRGTGLAPAASIRPALDGGDVDPVFAFDDAGGLLPVAPCRDDAARAWLAGRIVRDRLDVAAHARRVVLACRRGLADDAFGALVDLFLATGPRVRALREALLDHAAGLLDPASTAFLREALDGGLGPDATVPLGTRARLDRGGIGSADLVRHDAPPLEAEAGAGAAADGPVHVRAALLIDQGDVDAARILLEQALLADPQDADSARELQAIYRHARDDAGRAAMGRRLAARLGRVPETWS